MTHTKFPNVTRPVAGLPKPHVRWARPHLHRARSEPTVTLWGPASRDHLLHTPSIEEAEEFLAGQIREATQDMPLPRIDTASVEYRATCFGLRWALRSLWRGFTRCLGVRA